MGRVANIRSGETASDHLGYGLDCVVDFLRGLKSSAPRYNFKPEPPPSNNIPMGFRGGSRNSLKGGGFWARILRRGGARVQVRGNFHILTSKKNKNLLGLTHRILNYIITENMSDIRVCSPSPVSPVEHVHQGGMWMDSYAPNLTDCHLLLRPLIDQLHPAIIILGEVAPGVALPLAGVVVQVRQILTGVIASVHEPAL